jgi:hypothetical protein
MVEGISTNVQHSIGIAHKDIDRAKKTSFPSASVTYKEGLLFAAQTAFRSSHFSQEPRESDELMSVSTMRIFRMASETQSLVLNCIVNVSFVDTQSFSIW